MTVSFEHSKDDQDQAVTWPSLKTLGRAFSGEPLVLERKIQLQCIDYFVKMFSTSLDWSYVVSRAATQLQHHRNVEAYLEHVQHLRWSFFVKIVYKGYSQKTSL